MKPIPDYGDHMTLEQFVLCVEQHSFIDNDGSGYYATATEMTRLEAIPSNITKGMINKEFSHVVWFNK